MHMQTVESNISDLKFNYLFRKSLQPCHFTTVFQVCLSIGGYWSVFTDQSIEPVLSYYLLVSNTRVCMIQSSGNARHIFIYSTKWVQKPRPSLSNHLNNAEPIVIAGDCCTDR